VIPRLADDLRREIDDCAGGWMNGGRLWVGEVGGMDGQLEPWCDGEMGMTGQLSELGPGWGEWDGLGVGGCARLLSKRRTTRHR